MDPGIDFEFDAIDARAGGFDESAHDGGKRGCRGAWIGVVKSSVRVRRLLVSSRG